jgi:hypothetical protein
MSTATAANMSAAAGVSTTHGVSTATAANMSAAAGVSTTHGVSTATADMSTAAGMSTTHCVSTAAVPFAMRITAVPSSAVGIVAMIGFIAAPAVIAASAAITEAMFAPSVSVAPAGPGTHTEEDAVVEVSWPVKAIGRAAVGRSFVIAVGADRWNADFDCNLSFSRWRQDQSR